MSEQIILTSISKNDLAILIKMSLRELLSEYNVIKNKENKENSLLTMKQVADLLSVSLPTIIKWNKEGKIPFCKVGKRVYFKKDEVLESVQTFKIKTNE
jgi:excisionase family DNA binding protein